MVSYFCILKLKYNYLLGGDFHGSNLNGHYWREQRRFNLRVFRDFGVGKNVMQEKILEEVEYMLANICSATNDNNNTSPSRVDVDICDYFDICIGSIINNMLFGYRFDEVKLFIISHKFTFQVKIGRISTFKRAH
jgi:hypothetical protein